MSVRTSRISTCFRSTFATLLAVSLTACSTITVGNNTNNSNSQPLQSVDVACANHYVTALAVGRSEQPRRSSRSPRPVRYLGEDQEVIEEGSKRGGRGERGSGGNRRGSRGRGGNTNRRGSNPRGRGRGGRDQTSATRDLSATLVEEDKNPIELEGETGENQNEDVTLGEGSKENFPTQKGQLKANGPAKSHPVVTVANVDEGDLEADGNPIPHRGGRANNSGSSASSHGSGSESGESSSAESEEATVLGDGDEEATASPDRSPPDSVSEEATELDESRESEETVLDESRESEETVLSEPEEKDSGSEENDSEENDSEKNESEENESEENDSGSEDSNGSKSESNYSESSGNDAKDATKIQNASAAAKRGSRKGNQIQSKKGINQSNNGDDNQNSNQGGDQSQSRNSNQNNSNQSNSNPHTNPRGNVLRNTPRRGGNTSRRGTNNQQFHTPKEATTMGRQLAIEGRQKQLQKTATGTHAITNFLNPKPDAKSAHVGPKPAANASHDSQKATANSQKATANTVRKRPPVLSVPTRGQQTANSGEQQIISNISEQQIISSTTANPRSQNNRSQAKVNENGNGQNVDNNVANRSTSLHHGSGASGPGLVVGQIVQVRVKTAPAVASQWKEFTDRTYGENSNGTSDVIAKGGRNAKAGVNNAKDNADAKGRNNNRGGRNKNDNVANSNIANNNVANVINAANASTDEFAKMIMPPADFFDQDSSLESFVMMGTRQKQSPQIGNSLAPGEVSVGNGLVVSRVPVLKNLLSGQELRIEDAVPLTKEDLLRCEPSPAAKRGSVGSSRGGNSAMNKTNSRTKRNPTFSSNVRVNARRGDQNLPEDEGQEAESTSYTNCFSLEDLGIGSANHQPHFKLLDQSKTNGSQGRFRCRAQGYDHINTNLSEGAVLGGFEVFQPTPVLTLDGAVAINPRKHIKHIMGYLKDELERGNVKMEDMFSKLKEWFNKEWKPYARATKVPAITMENLPGVLHEKVRVTRAPEPLKRTIMKQISDSLNHGTPLTETVSSFPSSFTSWNYVDLKPMLQHPMMQSRKPGVGLMLSFEPEAGVWHGSGSYGPGNSNSPGVVFMECKKIGDQEDYWVPQEAMTGMGVGTNPMGMGTMGMGMGTMGMGMLGVGTNPMGMGALGMPMVPMGMMPPMGMVPMNPEGMMPDQWGGAPVTSRHLPTTPIPPIPAIPEHLQAVPRRKSSDSDSFHDYYNSFPPENHHSFPPENHHSLPAGRTDRSSIPLPEGVVHTCHGQAISQRGRGQSTHEIRPNASTDNTNTGNTDNRRPEIRGAADVYREIQRALNQKPQ